MFDWITKPYIQWNVLDTILCYVEVGILLLILVVVIVEIQDLIEKRKSKFKKEIK